MIGTLIGTGNNVKTPQNPNQGGTVVVCQKSDLYKSRVLKRRQNFMATASLWLQDKGEQKSTPGCWRFHENYTEKHDSPWFDICQTEDIWLSTVGSHGSPRLPYSQSKCMWRSSHNLPINERYWQWSVLFRVGFGTREEFEWLTCDVDNISSRLQCILYIHITHAHTRKSTTCDSVTTVQRWTVCLFRKMFRNNFSYLYFICFSFWVWRLLWW